MTRRTTLFCVLLLGLAVASPVGAQLYTLEIPNLVGNNSAPVFVPTYLDNSSGTEVQGFSFAVCVDPAALVTVGGVPGVDLAQVNGGAGPDFFQVDVFTSGYSIGCVVDFLGVEAIPPAFGYELIVAEFDVIGALGTSTPLDICSSFGVGVVVVVNGGSVVPFEIDGVLDIALPSDVGFKFSTPQLAVPNLPVSAFVQCDNAVEFEGFSFGFTYDAGQLSLAGIQPTGVLAATNGGAGPDFFSANLFPGGGIGATVECTITTGGPTDTIAVGVDQDIVELQFDVGFAAGPPCSVTPLAFSGTLGVPPVPIQSIVAGVPEPSDASNGGLEIGIAPLTPPTGGITLRADSVAAVPGALAQASVYVDHDVPLEALSFGISYVPTDLSLFEIEPGAQLATTGCANGPDFYVANLHTGTGFGATVAAVFGLTMASAGDTLAPAGNNELVRLRFATNPNPTTNGSSLVFTDTLGSPPVAIEVTIDGQAVVPNTTPGAIVFGTGFTRGDCNDDGSNNIADAVFFLGSIFPPVGGGNTPPCDDACDANDDGNLDIADAITLLDSLFAGGVLPQPSNCGSDPTDTDSLDCGLSDACF